MSWGWECGIQHFIFVLLVQIFIGSYSSQTMKFVECILLFLLGLGLYIWQLTFEPIQSLTPRIAYLFTLINILFVFVSIIVILHFFTHDRMETEAKLARFNVKLMNDAYHDPLTKLRNRESVRNFIKEKINADMVEGGLCIAMGDIDFFKKVNDTYGHAAGDEVLITLAKLFEDYMKDHGIVARWGGEEFLFMFVNENLDEAGKEVFEILSKVRDLPIPWKDEVLHLTMTFGVSDVAMTSEDELLENIKSAIASADEKLYMGKQNGRNTVII
ncbi:MAG: GGDEF domain-containing protein [Lachnospiraceae bacterium]|nr:GGDEF domain-containing protein [Lachnospiraceae bacterium]